MALAMFAASPAARAHTADKLARELSRPSMQKAICHSLPIGQAALTVAGVKLLNSILPGKVAH